MNDNYIYGRNAIIEALQSDKGLEKIYLQYGTHGDSINNIHSLAKKHRVQLTVLDKGKFLNMERTLLPKDAKSQGVIALIEQLEAITIQQLVDYGYEKSNYPFIVALDEITDPHNLGAIARSAECAGASGLIIPEFNSAPITPVAIKASAGALNVLPVAKVKNLTHALIELKDNGYWLIGTDAAGERNYTDNMYDRPVVFVIGSEGKGLRPTIAKQCDELIRIPLFGQISSLNASVSAAIVLFELQRQRNFEGTRTKES